MEFLRSFKEKLLTEPSPSQKELLFIAQQNFSQSLEEKDFRLEQDDKYLRVRDKRGEIAGNFYNHRYFPATYLTLNKGYEDLAMQFADCLPEGLIYERDIAIGKENFTFHPELTEEEIAILQTKIQPVDNNIVVTQGEYAVVKNDDPNSLLSTFSANPCRSLLVYDLDSRLAALAHSDKEFADISLVEQMVRDLTDEGADPKRVAFQGSAWVDPMKKICVFDRMFSSTRYDLPEDFSFDLDKREVFPFDVRTLSEIDNLDIRVEKKIDVLINHHISYIRSY